jgi:hypothetical protein
MATISPAASEGPDERCTGSESSNKPWVEALSVKVECCKLMPAAEDEQLDGDDPDNIC